VGNFPPCSRLSHSKIKKYKKARFLLFRPKKQTFLLHLFSPKLLCANTKSPLVFHTKGSDFSGNEWAVNYFGANIFKRFHPACFSSLTLKIS